MAEDEKLVVMTDRWDGADRVPRSRVIDAALEDGHMDLLPGKGTLLPSGKFRAEALEDAILYELDKARGEGRSGLIFVWDLEWLSKEPKDFEAHIVHRSGMALSALPSDLTVMGQYGLAHCSAQQVERVLRVSPLVLEDGQLKRNFWVLSTTSMGRPPRDGHRTIPRARPEAGEARSL